MESFHPTPVVPSNAPLWTDIDQESRVLREQCSNRQLGYLQTQSQDYFPHVSDDSTCGSAGARASVYQPQYPRASSYQYPWMAGLAHNKYRGMDKNELSHQAKDRDAEMQARMLAARFARCDGYIKYRNRQPKEKKGSKEDAKWPDHIEDAFIIALCRHPPCGRKKFKSPGEEDNDDAKVMGRNELIADYILRNTGESRTRKQVSSHIQVLKPFVQNEPIIMRFLATPGDKESAATKAARKKASIYNPSANSRTGSLQQHHTYPLDTTFAPQPEEFCMFMRTTDSTSNVLHTYTTTDDYSPSTCYIQTQAELYDCFPGLANVPIDRLISGKFLALHVPITLHPRNMGGSIELAISWVFKAAMRNPPVTVSSRTKLYLHGRPIYYDHNGIQFYDSQPATFDLTPELQKMQRDYAEQTKDCKASVVPDDVKTEEGRPVRYYVPFSSTFWARYLFHVSTLSRSVSELEARPLQIDESPEDRAESLFKKRNEVSSSLDDLIAVQEIVAQTDSQAPHVVLTVHFSFSLATNKEAPVTSWQYLDMSNAFQDTIPLSTGGVSQISTSASDSQDSEGQLEPYNHSYTSFDFLAPPTSTYDVEGGGTNGLASPIELQEQGAVGEYNASWLNGAVLPTTTSELEHLNVGLLDPMLGTTQQTQQHNLHDVNEFDFSNENISISLDESALSPNTRHNPASGFDTHTTQTTNSFGASNLSLDIDLATDPLLLQPSRTSTPWITSATATPTDYAALFSQPHSPAFEFPGASSAPHHQDNLHDHLGSSVAEHFDLGLQPGFSLSTHGSFAVAGAGAGLDTNSESERQHQHSRQQSFAASAEDTEAGGHDNLDPQHGFDPSSHFQPTRFEQQNASFEHQGSSFGFKDEFPQDDAGFGSQGVFSQQTESFPSFDVGETRGFELDGLGGHETQGHRRGQGHEQGQGQREQRHRPTHSCHRCADLAYCACVSGGAGF